MLTQYFSSYCCCCVSVSISFAVKTVTTWDCRSPAYCRVTGVPPVKKGSTLFINAMCLRTAKEAVFLMSLA